MPCPHNNPHCACLKPCASPRIYDRSVRVPISLSDGTTVIDEREESYRRYCDRICNAWKDQR